MTEHEQRVSQLEKAQHRKRVIASVDQTMVQVPLRQQRGTIAHSIVQNDGAEIAKEQALPFFSFHHSEKKIKTRHLRFHLLRRFEIFAGSQRRAVRHNHFAAPIQRPHHSQRIAQLLSLRIGWGEKI
jgi:hypothetical protein